MKKLFYFILVAAAVACAAACKPLNGPEAAAKAALSALQKGDYNAYAASYNLSEDDQKMLAGMIEEKLSKEIEEKGGIKSFKIVGSELNENKDKATVSVQLNYKNGTVEDQKMTFVKVGDDWKQELDK